MAIETSVYQNQILNELFHLKGIVKLEPYFTYGVRGTAGDADNTISICCEEDVVVKIMKGTRSSRGFLSNGTEIQLSNVPVEVVIAALKALAK